MEKSKKSLIFKQNLICLLAGVLVKNDFSSTHASQKTSREMILDIL